MSTLRPYTKEWLEELCVDSNSLAEVLRKAGRKQGGGSQATLKKKIEEYGIDISHFSGQAWNKGKTAEDDSRIAAGAKHNEKYSKEEVFVKNSPISQRGLRGYVERYQVIPYQCAICGCDGHWQGGKIALELHHKDGDNSNNEISNLEYRCPNCHALSQNYRGKNKEKPYSEPLSDEVFCEALKNTSNIRQALIQLDLAPAGANYDRAKRLLEEYHIIQQ